MNSKGKNVNRFARALGLVALCPVFLCGLACGGDEDAAPPCSYKGQVYEDQQEFEDDCNSCTCNALGTPGVSCTTVGCSKNVTCTYKGHVYQDQEEFKDDCNSCTCDAHGTPGVSCTIVECADQVIEREIEYMLSISEGLYGQTTSHDDIGDNPVEYFEDFPLEIFTEEPSSNPEDGAEPHARTASGTKGFFEIALDPGDYWACTSFRRCTKFTAAPGSLVRLDYEFSVGPGWSTASPASR